VCYTYDAFGRDELPNEIVPEPGEWGNRTDEVELLYAALEALLEGADIDWLDNTIEFPVDISELDPEELFEIFELLLPGVLELEVPDISVLAAMYDECDFPPSEAEMHMMNAIGFAAENPGLAIVLAFEDWSETVSQYPVDGPNPGSGCFGIDMNAVVVAITYFYRIGEAIGFHAADVLGLNLEDEDDYILGALIAGVFLYLYFVDYIEHINLWLIANGEEPIDLTNINLSQMQQGLELLGFDVSYMQSKKTNKISGFFGSIINGVKKLFSGSSNSSNSRSNADELAALNPLTYRGYLWDEDVEMYYLKSRFYDANVGRFLNADSIFDTQTGVLGTNLFAYCGNNPVNRVDKTGMWSYDVHIGKDGNLIQAIALQGPDSVYNGIKYGTLQWAEDMRIKDDYAKTIALGNWLMQDAIIRILGWGIAAITLNTELFWDVFGWHGNINLFKLVPDSRDYHMLETLIKLEVNCKLFENGCLPLGLEELGRALHPVQDKDGHADYWQIEPFALIYLVSMIVVYGMFDGDDVGAYIDQDEVRYYQTENLSRTRDVTYDVIGRFAKQYPVLRGGAQ